MASSAAVPSESENPDRRGPLIQRIAMRLNVPGPRLRPAFFTLPRGRVAIIVHGLIAGHHAPPSTEANGAPSQHEPHRRINGARTGVVAEWL